SLGAALALTLAAGDEARAQTALLPPLTLPTIQNNDYALEIFSGPLFAPIHVIGVGGAYVASAEDTEGAAVNAASPAVRDAFSVDWFDYDLSASVSLPGLAAGGADYDNSGGSSAGNFVDVNFGATLQFGGLGFAATGDINRYEQVSAASGTDGESLSMSIGRWKALAAYGFFDGQLSIGGGLRVLTMQIDDNTS